MYDKPDMIYIYDIRLAKKIRFSYTPSIQLASFI